MSRSRTRNAPRSRQARKRAITAGAVTPVRSYPRNTECALRPTRTPSRRASPVAGSSSNRRSATTPTCSPAASSTGSVSTSLRIMATSGDPTDHVPAQPPLEPGDLERVSLHPQLQDGADLRHLAPGDPVQATRRRPAAEQPRGQDRSADQRGDRRRPPLVEPLAGLQTRQLQIVDRGDGLPVDVEHLAVEEAEPGVDDAAGDARRGRQALRHEPAPDAIMRGIAAIEAMRMIARNTSPTRFVVLPLTWSPM